MKQLLLVFFIFPFSVITPVLKSDNLKIFPDCISYVFFTLASCEKQHIHDIDKNLSVLQRIVGYLSIDYRLIN